MAQFNFPIPANLDELLRLVNENNRRLRLSLVRADGGVMGYYAAEYGTRTIPNPNGRIEIISGSLDDARPVFVADNLEQAAAFLCGTFMGAFGGRPLEDIQDEVSRKRIETDF